MDRQRATRPATRKRPWPAPGKPPGTSAPGPAKPPTAELDADHPHQNPFPIVGVGASAGGLEAFRDLLGALPTDAGMAYVLVQHLDPRHESILAELLSRATPMPVVEVKDDTPVAPNRVYVIPPLHDIALGDRTLKLVPRTQTRGQHMPIDHFLRSLAEVQGSKAIGVILSGTASDGTVGLKAIKAEGGITFAQEPRSAQYDGMPRSAMAAGCVDLVLTPKRIARELARLGRHPYVATRASRAEPADAPIPSKADQKGGLGKILALLKKATGADFSSYKPATIRRRIARRMAVHHIETVEGYAEHLEAEPEELQALLQDCLITVTSFFRDREAFEALSERVLPLLLEDRPSDTPIRVWVPGCATGEEVYSLVICLLERAGELAKSPSLQVFATDLSDRALEKARAGSYLESIAQDVSPERLRRFFSRVDGQYQVNKTLREMCVFARHDLIRDPPFSRVDFISCRNLLIYLETRWQERVLATFHYALNPAGCLMLGPAETVGAASALFAPLGDVKHRLYSRRPAARPPFFIPGAALGERANVGGQPVRITPRAARRSEVPREADRILLARYAPAGVVVDEGLRILEFRGDTHPYLEHAHGQASLDLMKMARKGLLLELRQAVEEAKKKDAVVRRERVRLYPGRLRTLNLQVIPIKGPAAGERCLLILFEGVAAAKPRPAAPAGRRRRAPGPDDRQLGQLQQELAETRQYLGTVMQEHEAAYEELQSSHEEILSSNEELQSVNEELGTAKEEIQSANEELSTLNQELEDRNARLQRLNDDLLNLLGSVDIPIVMVGRDLRVRRFTAAAEKLFNLIPSDVGRPLGDIRSNLEGIDLEREVLQVIDSLHSSDREVQDRQGRFHAMRIRPYLTAEKRIEGAVLALVDVDALKRSSERIQRALDYANAIVSTVREPLLILDQDLRVERASPAFYENFRVSPEQTEGRRLYELGDGQWDIPALRTTLEEVLPRDRSLDGFEVEHDFPEIGRRTMVLNARRLQQGDGREERILVAIQDRTEVRRAEGKRETLLALEQSARKQAESADRLKEEFMATVSHELRGPLTTMLGWIDLLRAGKPDETTLARGLAAIDRGVTAQARLIEDLLDHSLMMAGKLRLSYRLIDLVPIAEAAAESLRPAAEAKQIHLELVREAPTAALLGDPDRMQQVVWNLLSNAVKFTPRGGRVEVWIGRVDDRIHLKVSDSGLGIHTDFLPHVFDRFRQADSSSTRSQAGLGLGLAIVRQLVELHDGTVRAESDGESRGATFTVALPIPDERIAAMDTEGKEPAAIVTPLPGQGGPEHHPALLRGVSVLLVEDDTDARETLAMVLERCGAKVTPAASAGEAMKALARALPDVLVSDIKMAGEDGYDLIRKVRGLRQERGGRIPALALTAYAGAEHARKALAAGFEAHVAKPAAAAELVTKVARLAGRSRSI